MNLNQVTVPVTDVESAVTFYQKLGLKLIVLAPHYARFECPEGDATFSVHKVEAVVEVSPVVVYFEVKELNAMVRTLIANGIVFDELPIDQRWLWREARLRDPDNNRLIIYYAGVNRKNPPWRLVH